MESWKIAVIFFSIYCTIGVICLEWAWIQIKPLREVNEERDKAFPAYRRFDAPLWKKWKFYPGALFLLTVRLVLIIFLWFLCYLILRIVSIGHSFEQGEPLRGCRGNMTNKITKFMSGILMIAMGMRSSKMKLDIDYSEYLGDDYKLTNAEPKNVSTFVSNHSTWVDISLLMSYYGHAFVSKLGLKNAPLAGFIS